MPQIVVPYQYSAAYKASQYKAITGVEGGLTSTDERVRAALDAARGAITSDDVRYGLNRPVFDGQGDLMALPVLDAGGDFIGRDARSVSRGKPGLAEVAFERALSSGAARLDGAEFRREPSAEVADDAWAPAPLTLGESQTRGRWWAGTPVDDPELGFGGGESTVRIDELAPSSRGMPDPSHYLRLTQAMAAFGGKSGAGAAVWKRSGEASDMVEMSVSSRPGRWNFGRAGAMNP